MVTNYWLNNLLTSDYTATVITIQKMKSCVNSDSYVNSWLAIIQFRLLFLKGTMMIINIGFTTTASLVRLFDTLIKYTISEKK